MPQFQVQSPDGATYSVNAPEGATEADAIAYVQQNYGGMQPALAGGRPAGQGGAPTPPAHRPSGPPTYPRLDEILRNKLPQAVITSTKRSPQHNAAVGGAPHSMHLGGYAIDFVPPKGTTLEQAKRIFADSNVPLDEALDEGDHFHFGAYSVPNDPKITQVAKQFGVPEIPQDYVPSAPPMLRPRPKRAPDPMEPDDVGAALYGIGDTATFGHLDELGAVVDSVVPGQGRPTVWDGKSFTGAWSENVARNREILHGAADRHPKSTIAGQIGGGFLPGLGIVKGAAGGATVAAKLGRAALGGAASGALYGEGSADGGLADKAIGAGAGAVLGGTLGAGATGLGLVAKKPAEIILQKALQSAPGRAARTAIDRHTFVGRNANDPLAPYISEVVQDLADLPNRVASPMYPQGRSVVTAKEINALGRSYSNGMLEEIGRLDVPDARKLVLKKALRDWLTIKDKDVADLKTDAAGQAVAGAILKTKALYKMTPEVTAPRMLGEATDVVAGLAGMAVDGVSGGIVGGFGSKLVRKALRKPADAEAARVHSAEKLIRRAGKYRNLGERVGPSGAAESQKTLADLAADATTRAERAQALMAIDKATRPSSLEIKDFRANLLNGTPHPNDDAIERSSKLSDAASRFLDRSPNKMFDFDIKVSQDTPEQLAAFRQQIADKTIDPNDLLVPQTDSALASKAQSRASAIDKLQTAQRQWDKALGEDLGIGTRRTYAYGPNPAPVAAPPPDRAAILRNAIDNIKPGGGFMGLIYEKTGLLPREASKAITRIQAQGKISMAQKKAAFRDSMQLQNGNVGNAIIDRLNKLADDGAFARDPNWAPVEAGGLGVAEQPSAFIRNPLSYAATARGNQDRVSQTLGTLHADASIPDNVKQVIGDAITRLGTTSKATDADAIVSAARQAVPESLKDYTARLLSPIAQQIKN